jgi:hypothetical protein
MTGSPFNPESVTLTSAGISNLLGNAIQGHVSAITHYSFYALTFGLAGTGLATAFLAGLFPIVYRHPGASLPHSFLVYPTRIAQSKNGDRSGVSQQFLTVLESG